MTRNSSCTIEFSKGPGEPSSSSPTSTESSSSSSASAMSASSPYPVPWEPSFEEIELGDDIPIGTAGDYYNNHHHHHRGLSDFDEGLAGKEQTAAMAMSLGANAYFPTHHSHRRRLSFRRAIHDYGVYFVLFVLVILFINRISLYEEESSTSSSTTTPHFGERPHFELHPQVLPGAFLALSEQGRVLAVAEATFRPPQDQNQDDVTRVVQMYRLLETAVVDGENPSNYWEPMGQSLDFYHSSSMTPIVDLSANGLIMALITSTSRTVQVMEYDSERDEWVPQATNDQLLGVVEAEVGLENDSFTSRLSASAVSLSADGTILAVSGMSVFSSTGARRSHLMVFRFDGINWTIMKGASNLLADPIQDGLEESLGQTLVLQSVQLSQDGSTLAIGGHYSESDHLSSPISVVKIYKQMITPAKQQDLQEEDEETIQWVNVGEELAIATTDPFTTGHSNEISLSYNGNVLAVANTETVQVYSYAGQRSNHHEWTPMGVGSIPKKSYQILSVSLSSQGNSFALGRVMIDDPTMSMVDYYQYRLGGPGSGNHDGQWEHIEPILYDDEAFMFGRNVALSSTTMSVNGLEEATLAIGTAGRGSSLTPLRTAAGEVYIYRLTNP